MRQARTIGDTAALRQQGCGRRSGQFYVASNRRLLPSAVSEAARQAGYDPRGTGGFYTGNGYLRSDEDYRVLTQVGIDLFESAYPRYKEQLLKKFSDAPDIGLN